MIDKTIGDTAVRTIILVFDKDPCKIAVEVGVRDLDIPAMDDAADDIFVAAQCRAVDIFSPLAKSDTCKVPSGLNVYDSSIVFPWRRTVHE